MAIQSALFLWVLRLLGAPFRLPYRLARDLWQLPSRTYPVVDFLKGLSVLMVILFHIFFAVFILYKDDMAQLQHFIATIPPSVSFILGFDKAVDIFFMLSSFLLTFGLLRTFDKQGTFSVSRFYLHRFFRLYPLFLVALLLYGLADIDKLIRDGWYSLLFIENIFSKGIIPVQWSLSIEVQFYLVLPFLVLFIARSRSPLLWLSLLILLSMGMRFAVAASTAEIYQTPWVAMIAQPEGKIYMDAMYYVIESRLTPLILGMFWATLLWKYPNVQLKLPNWALLAVWGLAITTVYITLRFPVYHEAASYYQPFNEFFNLIVVSLHRNLFSLALLALILVSHYQTSHWQFKSFTHWQGWRVLSELAYPMYFFHFPFVAIAWVLVLGTTNLEDITHVSLSLIPAVFILAVLMTLYLSLWLHYLVEARFIRLGKQIESKWFGGHNGRQTHKND